MKLDNEIINLLNTLNIGFIHLDMDFGILEVNEKIIEWYGGTRRDLVGHNCREFFTPEDFNRLRTIDLEYLHKGFQHYQYEFELPTSKGGRTPFLINLSVNKDAGGAPDSTNVLLTDISEQKRMQEELTRTNIALAASQEALGNEKKMIEAILFGIGDCVTIFDHEGNLLLSNPMGKEIRGDRITPLIDLDSTIEKIINFEISGEHRQFAGRIENIHDNFGRVKAYAEILKEITDQIKLEERENELRLIKRRMQRGEIESEMIGVSPAMGKVFDLILRCAEVDSSILILGETGVGKELAARAMHTRSKRKGSKFVAVNCGSIPEALLESELFGHEKGAFTGAVTSRIGLFREADGGTLFLDEVGDLNVALQVKLLRALQEKEIRPVGGNRTFPINVRIISATNRNLTDLISRGLFREDLYYRIAVIPIVIPPLRERREDILYLADHFIKKHCKKDEKTCKRLEADARQLLLSHQWPGNIRELENAIEYAIAMSADTIIKPNDFPLQIIASRTLPESSNGTIQTALTPLHQAPSLDRFEIAHLRSWEQDDRRLIAETLENCRGNRKEAAEKLSISRSTLWRKIKTYHIT
ncbi:MAG: PAS domain S-box protein [Spirochaetes bacterium]|nr:MAG: PAS domain S-box protein [Spirochaetota bacterium]